MTEESDSWSYSSEFYEQEETGIPRIPAGTNTTSVPVTDYHPSQELPAANQEQKDQNDEMSSSVVDKQENKNAPDHQEGEHIPRPLLKKLIQVLAYPATAAGEGHPRGSPTKVLEHSQMAPKLFT